MKKSLHLAIVCLCLSGCTILSHLDELSVMGDYSRDKDNQRRLVKLTDDHYDALTKAIDAGTISKYKDRVSFVSSFGAPILKKELKDGQEQWLYRHAILSTAKTKVYVYFDSNAKLIKWERVLCPSFF